ncbi:MAG: c-type cytochrome [Opitutaceae bacterium]
MRYLWLAFFFVVVAALSILGFRGSLSSKPPIEVFPDMDRQPKYKPQAESEFFADGNTDRPVPANVVARGRSVGTDSRFLAADDHMYRGYTGPLGLPENTNWFRGFPEGVEITQAFLQRGQERYTIFCAPCHGALGDGSGITRQYGMGATPTYHSDRIRQMPEGEIFNTITNGRNTMFAYGDKIKPAGRWAIVAYIRALQRAQQGSVEDVPAANRSELGL